MARTNSRKTVSAPAAVELDVVAIAERGVQVAQALQKVGNVAENCYATVRTIMVDAQKLGKLSEAHAAFFDAGNAVKFGKGNAGGAKWRTYKSLFGSAAKYSIALSHDMSQAQLAAAIKEAKGGMSDEDRLKMALNFCASYLNNGGSKAALLKAIKELEA